MRNLGKEAVPIKLTEIFAEKPIEQINVTAQNEAIENVLDRAGLEKGKLEIAYLPTEMLDDFFNHPFRKYQGKQLQELADSITENGILTPLLVRPKGHRWELLSGHNRKAGAELVGLMEVPCIILDVVDDAAAIIVTESNLQQRQNLFPSERARAYKMQFEALKNQQKNTEKFLEISGSENENRKLSRGETEAISRATIYRYLKLNNLSPLLLKKVDDRTITLDAGGELSYLESNGQEAVYQYFFEQGKGLLTYPAAQMIRQLAKKKAVTLEELERLFTKKAKAYPASKNFSVPYKRIQAYIPPDLPKKAQQDYVIDALEYYNDHMAKKVTK